MKSAPASLISASDEWENTYTSWSSQPEAAAFTGKFEPLIAEMRKSPAEACDYYFTRYPAGNTEYLLLLSRALDIDITQIETQDGFREKLTPLIKEKRTRLAQEK